MPKRATGCLEASATSLHSSGQDSGIVARACHCGHSSSPSSGDSSNGYEDSLKSLHRSNVSNDVSPRGQRELGAGEKHPTTSTRGRHRFHSFSNAESIYARDTSLSREMRHRTNTEKRNLQRDRTLPELHVSRTMIRGNTNKADGAISQSMTRLHGATGSCHSLFW
ncbi:hypothetical protein PV326_001981 [Microctonus aethiopoides]|nr:hypothetical protein PV326_001981 [Microctonus aethiopoides]